MITDALIRLFSAIVNGLLAGAAALVPPVPSWAGDGFSAAGTVWGVTRSMDAWMPVSFTVGVVLAILAAYAVTLVIGTVKLVAGYVTLGGGVT